MTSRLLLLFALAFGPAGCAFDVDACASDDDCPEGSKCGRPPGTDVPMCLTASPPAAPDGSDAQPPDDTPDAATSSDTGSDATHQTCPSVQSCGEQEPNDTEDDAIYLTRFAEGCGGFSFEEWAVIHQDSLCAGDVDHFVIEYVPCERGAYLLTVSLTAPDTCADGGELRIAEGLYDCSDDDVRCESVNGVQRITILVDDGPGAHAVEKIRFAVSPGAAPDGLQYILRATIDR